MSMKSIGDINYNFFIEYVHESRQGGGARGGNKNVDQSMMWQLIKI